MCHGLEVDRHCGIPGLDSQLFNPETDVDHLGWQALSNGHPAKRIMVGKLISYAGRPGSIRHIGRLALISNLSIQMVGEAESIHVQSSACHLALYDQPTLHGEHADVAS